MVYATKGSVRRMNNKSVAPSSTFVRDDADLFVRNAERERVIAGTLRGRGR